MVFVTATWSDPEQVVPGAGVTSSHKPAICEFNGRAFLAWATQPDPLSGYASSFSFTSRLLSDDGWAPPKLVFFNDTMSYQTHTSALAVFQNVLYAFVPYKSSDVSGLAIFSYNGATFVYAGNWGDTWNTDIAAIVCDDTLHIIGARQSDNQLFWTYSKPGIPTITGPEHFSADIQMGESTSSNPALIVRGGKVVALFLAHTDGRGVLELTLTMGASPSWYRTDSLDESGNSGISAMTTPDGQNSWICFKKHNGDSNLICRYKTDKTCWSSNSSLGDSSPFTCLNEAALAWCNNYVYAVWNTQMDGNPLYYSRTLMKQAPSVMKHKRFGTGYISDQPSPTDPVVNMSVMDMSAAQAGEHNISEPGWVLNQGHIESCTANATATAYRYELKRQNKQDFMTSRLYLYYLARLGSLMIDKDPSFQTAGFYNGMAKQPPTDEVTADDGSNIREAVKVLSCLGAISEDSWLYLYEPVKDSIFATGSNAAYPPQNGCFETAKKHFAVNYSLTLATEACWKGCISMGYPIVFGFNIYPSFSTFSDAARSKTQDADVIAPVPNPSVEIKDGGHAVLAVGWNDNVPNQAGGATGCFLIQNSWGTDWGKGGFFWMPYTWLTTEGAINDFGLTLMNSVDD